MSRVREGDPDLPRRPGEPLLDYMRRLAVFMGLKVDEAPEKRRMPDAVSFQDRLKAIWEPRQPGGEG